MNVIDYITITCNLKNGRLQITSDYMKKCNRLQLITITNYDYPMSGRSWILVEVVSVYGVILVEVVSVYGVICIKMISRS